MLQELLLKWQAELQLKEYMDHLQTQDSTLLSQAILLSYPFVQSVCLI